jgi:YhcH/YjgK/YiaL family protein
MTMILDRNENLRLYVPLYPLIRRVVEFLSAGDVASLPLGPHEIEGRLCFVIRNLAQGKGREGAVLEAHHKYIDIQIALDRPDVIGYSPLARCQRVREPYDAFRDIEFFADSPESWITLAPGSFAIFFPTDAHAPLAIQGQIQKAVFKLAMEP